MYCSASSRFSEHASTLSYSRSSFGEAAFLRNRDLGSALPPTSSSGSTSCRIWPSVGIVANTACSKNMTTPKCQESPSRL